MRIRLSNKDNDQSITGTHFTYLLPLTSELSPPASDGQFKSLTPVCLCIQAGKDAMTRLHCVSVGRRKVLLNF